MSQFRASIGCIEDNDQLQQLYSATQPTQGVNIAFERAPSYFNSEAIMYNQGKLLLVKHKENQEIAAAVNMGLRLLYVNGEPKLVHYGADMRIAPPYQGGRALFYINRQVKSVIAEGWYLTIILADNARSKESLEHGRAGLPFYKKLGEITTYTVTSFKAKTKNKQSVRKATENDIFAMNKFIEDMAKYYQFLPYYDFNELKTSGVYYNGLTISDFLLLEKNGTITGLVGLWDQSHIKQARVVSYDKFLGIIRPIYNAMNAVIGGFYLPKKGQLFKYLSLHSPLTAPNNHEGFTELLSAAWKTSKARGFRSMTLTLSAEDPRRKVLNLGRYKEIKASHYSVTYEQKNHPVLSSDLISYYECGRL